MAPSFTSFLLQVNDAGGPAGGGNGAPGFLNPLVMILVIFGIFWLIVFRPEAKKRKERQRRVDAMTKGAQVVTTGGIVGKVTRIDDKEVVVQVDKDKDVRLRFIKSAILDVLSAGAAPERGEKVAAGQDQEPDESKG
jgi:preprotein translocase subunit YajC